MHRSKETLDDDALYNLIYTIKRLCAASMKTYMHAALSQSSDGSTGKKNALEVVIAIICTKQKGSSVSA